MEVGQSLLLFALLILINCGSVILTIDLNIREVTFISNEMTFKECKLLAEALKRKEFLLQKKDLSGYGQLRNESCLDMLLRWDRTTARGKTFINLAHRLRQINREDLANKLSKTVYSEEAYELHKTFLDDPFLSMIATDSILLDNDKTTEKMIDIHNTGHKSSFWNSVTITAALLSLGLLVVVSFRRCCPGCFSRTWRRLAPDSLVECFDILYNEIRLCCNRCDHHYNKYVIGNSKESDDKCDIQFAFDSAFKDMENILSGSSEVSLLSEDIKQKHGVSDLHGNAYLIR